MPGVDWCLLLHVASFLAGAASARGTLQIWALIYTFFLHAIFYLHTIFYVQDWTHFWLLASLKTEASIHKFIEYFLSWRQNLQSVQCLFLFHAVLHFKSQFSTLMSSPNPKIVFFFFFFFFVKWYVFGNPQWWSYFFVAFFISFSFFLSLVSSVHLTKLYVHHVCF